VSDTSAGWVTIALLGKTRGNRGEITALALSSKPERYQALEEAWLFGGAGLPQGGLSVRVESSWFHQGILILKFQGVETISDAERLTGAEVRVPMDQRTPLDKDEYFESDLVGSEIVDRRSGQVLGRVTAWQDAGGAGLLVVDGDWLIPFARSICVEIDPAAKRIAVELPEGLRDVNRP
jgi:16S rRNA processing protein RimM